MIFPTHLPDRHLADNSGAIRDAADRVLRAAVELDSNVEANEIADIQPEVFEELRRSLAELAFELTDQGLREAFAAEAWLDLHKEAAADAADRVTS